MSTKELEDFSIDEEAALWVVVDKDGSVLPGRARENRFDAIYSAATKEGNEDLAALVVDGRNNGLALSLIISKVEAAGYRVQMRNYIAEDRVTAIGPKCKFQPITEKGD